MNKMGGHQPEPETVISVQKSLTLSERQDALERVIKDLKRQIDGISTDIKIIQGKQDVNISKIVKCEEREEGLTRAINATNQTVINILGNTKNQNQNQNPEPVTKSILPRDGYYTILDVAIYISKTLSQPVSRLEISRFYTSQGVLMRNGNNLFPTKNGEDNGYAVIMGPQSYRITKKGYEFALDYFREVV